MTKKDSSPKNRRVDVHIEPTSNVSSEAIIGEGTKIWAYSYIREDAKIGKNCVIGSYVYIDKGVVLGDHVHVQNAALIYRPVVLEDHVFIGPNVIFTNDKNPRSQVIRDLKGVSWSVGKGASIGAGALIMSDVNIGKYSLVGAKSLVTKPVPDHGLVFGVPARLKGFVCTCGNKLTPSDTKKNEVEMFCKVCNKKIIIPFETYKLLDT
jgi:UDP-2-acetamido-3-amino-2,3-dideoxy-glucuronate N-acetyltransferase